MPDPLSPTDANPSRNSIIETVPTKPGIPPLSLFPAPPIFWLPPLPSRRILSRTSFGRDRRKGVSWLETGTEIFLGEEFRVQPFRFERFLISRRLERRRLGNLSFETIQSFDFHSCNYIFIYTPRWILSQKFNSPSNLRISIFNFHVPEVERVSFPSPSFRCYSMYLSRLRRW